MTIAAQAIELPEIYFEPTMTTSGQPANRITTVDQQSLAEPATVFDVSRITVSAAGRQLNIRPNTTNDVVVPMLMEDTGMIGMQWYRQGTRLSSTEISAIQPNLKAINASLFKHYVSSKYLRRSATHNKRPMQAFTAKVAYPISIRPIADPTLLPAGSDLPVRLYLRGQPVSGALLTAENKLTHSHQSTHSDSSGFAVIKLQEAGNWQLSFSQIPLQSEVADTLYTAVLEFDNSQDGDRL